MKLSPGSRVEITRGQHRGKRGTVVEGAKVTLALFCGNAQAGPAEEFDIAKHHEHLILIKFDDDVGGGQYGTGVYRYSPSKVRIIPHLQELGEQSE